MKAIASISVSAVFALGMSAAIADEAKPEGAKPTRHVVAQAPAGSVQVAQAGAAAGGAAGGASTGGALGGIGVAGSTASTIVFVGAAIAGFAAVSDGATPPTSH